MRMHGFAKFGGGGLERLAEHDFGNDVGGGVSDYLASDHFAILFGRDDFHEARGLADRNRLAHRAKRNLADLHFDAARFCVRFAESHRRHFGLAVDASGDREQVETGFAHARHEFNRGDTFGAGLVREQRRADDVAERIDARDGGLERVVYLDEAAAFELDADFFE